MMPKSYISFCKFNVLRHDLLNDYWIGDVIPAVASDFYFAIGSDFHKKLCDILVLICIYTFFLEFQV